MSIRQRQDSLTDQLRDLMVVANRLGMYDAADMLQKTFEVQIETAAKLDALTVLGQQIQPDDHDNYCAKHDRYIPRRKCMAEKDPDPSPLCDHGINHSGERHGCDGCCKAPSPPAVAPRFTLPDEEEKEQREWGTRWKSSPPPPSPSATVWLPS